MTRTDEVIRTLDEAISVNPSVAKLTGESILRFLDAAGFSIIPTPATVSPDAVTRNPDTWPIPWGTSVRRASPALDRGLGVVVGCTHIGQPIVMWYHDGSVTRHYLQIDCDRLLVINPANDDATGDDSGPNIDQLRAGYIVATRAANAAAAAYNAAAALVAALQRRTRQP